MQANISSSYQSLNNITDQGNKNLIFAHHTCSAILRDFFKSCNEFALNNALTKNLYDKTGSQTADKCFFLLPKFAHHN